MRSNQLKVQAFHDQGSYRPSSSGTLKIVGPSASRGASQNEKTDAFIQEVINASGSSIAVLDQDRTILYVNRTWRQFASKTGSTAAQLVVGSTYPDICVGTAAASASSASAIARGIDSIFNRNEIEFKTEYKCTAVAEPVWFRLRAAAFQVPDQKGRSLVLVSHDDITSEKQAREFLAEDRERLERLWATTNILPWEADAKTWAFTYVGDQAEKMLGFAAEMWSEPDFWTTHIHPDDRERAVAECAKHLQTADQYQVEYRMIAKDGRVVWINDIVSVHRERGAVISLSGFMIDITEQKQAKDNMKLLAGRLITAQEEERKRIARDLHDDLNQRMALLSMELEQIGQMLTAKRDGIVERVKGLQKKAFRISTEIHRMSYTLHPSKLDYLGLVPALKSFCAEFAESRGVRVNFQQNGPCSPLPASVTLCLFRIAQEALQNAAKHSGESRFDVVLEQAEKKILLTVSDAGRGFDINQRKMTEGLGFISIRERLCLVKGSLEVHSQPLRGTRIFVSVPLDEGEGVQSFSSNYN